MIKMRWNTNPRHILKKKRNKEARINIAHREFHTMWLRDIILSPPRGRRTERQEDFPEGFMCTEEDVARSLWVPRAMSYMSHDEKLHGIFRSSLVKLFMHVAFCACATGIAVFFIFFLLLSRDVTSVMLLSFFSL